MLLILVIPFALTYTFGRHGRQRSARAGRSSRPWSSSSCVGVVVAMRSEERSQPALSRRRSPRSRPVGREHGGQGGPLRGRRRAACSRRSRPARAPAPSNSMHDSFLPIGGLVPLFNIELGEITPGGVGAGLYGILVFAHPRRLHRRADGRPDARVPRQEDRGLRDEDGDARRPLPGLQHPRLHRPRDGHAGGQGRAAQRRPPRLQRDPVRLLEPDRQQRLGLRRPDRQHALLQRHRRLRDAARALRDDRADPGHRRLDGRQAARRAVARHLPHDRRRSGSAC